MKANLYFFLVLSLMANLAFAQNESKPVLNQYLSLQSGILAETQYNSAGIRTFFEFQQDITQHKQFSLSYEHSTHFMDLATDHSDEIKSNISALCANFNYKIFLWKDKIYWSAGIGAGAVHVNWDNNNKISKVVNANLTLNLKITDKIIIETAPLLILFPFNRIYYSPVNVGVYNNMYAFTSIPLGLKVRI